MSFADRVVLFAERFLSDRTCQLVVIPAVADLQFEGDAGRVRRTVHRLAVLRALAGGVRDDVARASSGMLLLTLVPACYYVFLLVICFDVLSLHLAGHFLVAAMLIVVLSLGPAMACFWPARAPRRTLD